MLRRSLKELFLYTAAIAVTLLIFFYLVYPGFDLHLPLAYHKDAIFGGSSIKATIDHGWFLTNPSLGAPGVSSLIDFPQSDAASFLLIKFFALFSSDYAVVLNSFYLTTFLLTIVFSIFVLRVSKLSRVSAFAAGLLFTFMPYHLMRGEFHLLLSAIYVVPLYFLLMLSVYRPKLHPVLTNTVLLILIAIFCASSGVYYACFAAFFIFLTGLFAWLEQDKQKKLLKAYLLIAVIFATIVVNISSSLIEHHRLGPNHAMGRSAGDAENFGLKVNQMIMPVADHRLRGFQKAAAHYTKISPLVNENRSSALGILGSLGLFALLFMLLMRRDQIENATLVLLSRLTVFGILLGTVGGLGAVFAYRISPMIRSYNRISIFIAFFALLALFLILQRLLQSANKKFFAAIVLVLTVLGVLDETPATAKFINRYQDIAQHYASDRVFVAKIEAELPPNAEVFQLPYMVFPESATIVKMRDYEPFRLYLHSHYVHWSYAAIKGRTTAHWQEQVSQLALVKMVKTLQQAGFKGIVLDREGYQDRGAKLEKQLGSLLKIKPLVSDDGVFVFFNFHNFTPSR